MKGNLNDTAYNDMVEDSLLLTLWLQFGGGPFLFQHDNVTVHTARSRSGLVEIGVEELDWPPQSPNNPIDHLWDDLECQERARRIA